MFLAIISRNHPRMKFRNLCNSDYWCVYLCVICWWQAQDEDWHSTVSSAATWWWDRTQEMPLSCTPRGDQCPCSFPQVDRKWGCTPIAKRWNVATPHYQTQEALKSQWPGICLLLQYSQFNSGPEAHPRIMFQDHPWWLSYRSLSVVS